MNLQDLEEQTRAIVSDIIERSAIKPGTGVCARSLFK